MGRIDPIDDQRRSINSRGSLILRNRLVQFFSLSAIIFLAVALRVYNLGNESLWVDEALTWFFGRLDWPLHFHMLHLDGVHPPLSFSLAKLMMDWFGQQEIVLRSVPTIASALGLVGAILLGKKLAGPWGALGASWLWAFHPMLIWYSRDARPYSLAAALAMLLLYTFVCLRQGGKRYLWALAGVSLLLGFLTHYFFFLVALSLILFSMIEIRKNPIFFRNWTLMTFLASIPICIWIVWFFLQDAPALVLGWIRSPSIDDIGLTYLNLLTGFAGVLTPVSFVFGLLVLSLIVGNFFLSEETYFRMALLVIGLVLPVLFIFAFSQRRAIYMDRYFIVLIPYLTALMCYGVKGWQNAVSSWLQEADNPFLQLMVFVGWVILGIMVGLQIFHQEHYAREDWKTLSQIIEQYSPDRTSINVWSYDLVSRIALDYYSEKDLVFLEDSDLGSNTAGIWFIYRQPYTATHAFTQAVSEPGRGVSEFEISELRLSSRFSWESPTGLNAYYSYEGQRP